MRKCPQCGAETKLLPITGWLVYGTAFLQISEDGQEAITTIVTRLSFNEQGFRAHAQAQCSTCKYTGPIDSFPIIHVCFFTGESASMFVDVFGRSTWINEAILQDVNELAAVDLNFPWDILAESVESHV